VDILFSVNRCKAQLGLLYFFGSAGFINVSIANQDGREDRKKRAGSHQSCASGNYHREIS